MKADIHSYLDLLYKWLAFHKDGITALTAVVAILIGVLYQP
jgi:hypothetical protein